MAIKDWIKSLPLWAKSGIIVTVIYFVIYLIIRIFFSCAVADSLDFVIPSYCTSSWGWLFTLFPIKQETFLLSLIVTFLVGSLIGLIINKIRAK